MNPLFEEVASEMYYFSLLENVSENNNHKLHNETILCMLSKKDKVVDKDALEEIVEKII